DGNQNLLFAYPRIPGDSLEPELRPLLLEEGREPMEGDTMVYNLKSRQGKVLRGWTKAQDGFYIGREIRNQGNDALFVENSKYTTCDLDEPHFHFGSSEMKLIQHDKVIARPLILYIAGIPVLGLPFAIFPNQGGQRHSGWIMPSYGESSTRGQFIDGLGYYWASSPYWDTRVLLSFADRQGVTIKSRTPYRKRYRFSGNFYLETRQKLGSGEHDITRLSQNRKTDYIIKWNHRQQMRHNQSFNVNASYYSNGEYNRNTGLDPLNRMNQQAISNATYSKRWPKSNNSISINLSSRRDLMAERRIDSTSVFYQVPVKAGQEINQDTRTLPGLTFRHGQSPVLPGKWGASGPLKSTTWNYSMNLTHKERTFFQSVRADTGTGFYWDYTPDGSPNLKFKGDQVIHHTLSLNSPQKIFRYITVNPQLSLKSDWVNRTFSAVLDSNGKLVRSEVAGLAMRTTGSFNLRTNTQIYGLFPLRIGPVRGLRHVMSPSITFRFTPDFSKPVFGADLGYVQTLTDSAGETQIHDRFGGTLAGGTPTREVKAVGLALNNVFQAKVMQGDKEKKLDLFSWSLSTNYNYVADEFPLSNLQSSIRTRLTKGINLDLSMTHDFYTWDDSLGQRTENLRRGPGGLPVPRLLKVNLSTAFRFSGKRFAGYSTGDTTAAPSDSAVEELPEAYRFTNKLEDVGRPVEGG
ncbi:MAG: putative LPS assembly protein LptD, partial [Fidelibacterota bacterium]